LVSSDELVEAQPAHIKRPKISVIIIRCLFRMNSS
jgi:hypothetical protein